MNKTVSFDDHIKTEHNLWHYLYFIVLLKLKKRTDFTGPQSYVSELIKVNIFSGNEHTRYGVFEIQFFLLEFRK